MADIIDHQSKHLFQLIHIQITGNFWNVKIELSASPFITEACAEAKCTFKTNIFAEEEAFRIVLERF